MKYVVDFFNVVIVFMSSGLQVISGVVGHSAQDHPSHGFLILRELLKCITLLKKQTYGNETFFQNILICRGYLLVPLFHFAHATFLKYLHTD